MTCCRSSRMPRGSRSPCWRSGRGGRRLHRPPRPTLHLPQRLGGRDPSALHPGPRARPPPARARAVVDGTDVVGGRTKDPVERQANALESELLAPDQALRSWDDLPRRTGDRPQRHRPPGSLVRDQPPAAFWRLCNAGILTRPKQRNELEQALKRGQAPRSRAGAGDRSGRGLSRAHARAHGRAALLDTSPFISFSEGRALLPWLATAASGRPSPSTMATSCAATPQRGSRRRPSSAWADRPVRRSRFHPTCWPTPRKLRRLSSPAGARSR